MSFLALTTLVFVIVGLLNIGCVIVIILAAKGTLMLSSSVWVLFGFAFVVLLLAALALYWIIEAELKVKKEKNKGE